MQPTETRTAPEEGSQRLEKIYEKNGYYDGKIFYAEDRVTYTFIHEEEVVVLHLDLLKGALFFKGHRIVSPDIHPELPHFLGQFRARLAENPDTQRFIVCFESMVSALYA